ncbi:MAG TPA: ABC transporter substrate-binding protein, partial [Methylomirabilota bacterium]|nr:ABC transporter substrate-binding protein [Methylomirabilota bacterium]
MGLLCSSSPGFVEDLRPPAARLEAPPRLTLFPHEPYRSVMHRRAVILGSIGILVVPTAGSAQRAGKWRLGFLGVATAARFERFLEALRLGLREHGYVEGKNITIELRWAEGRYDRLPALAAELVRLNPDVLITHGTPGTLALKQATATIPIVMAIIGNPVEAGAVASLARPGGNVTGGSFFSDEVTAKRLELLKAALPDLARVGVLVNRDNVATPNALRVMEQVAQALNVKVKPLEVRRLDELDGALTVARTHTDGLVVPDEQLFSMGGTSRRIADLALGSRMPSIGPIEHADAGGLLGYGVDWADVVRRSMGHVDK